MARVAEHLLVDQQTQAPTQAPKQRHLMAKNHSKTQLAD